MYNKYALAVVLLYATPGFKAEIYYLFLQKKHRIENKVIFQIFYKYNIGDIILSRFIQYSKCCLLIDNVIISKIIIKNIDMVGLKIEIHISYKRY